MSPVQACPGKEKAMSAASVKSSGGSATKALLLGALSLGLFILLFTNEPLVLDLARQARWMFVVPVGIAFLFSFVHGAFTGAFWDALGIKAKK
jgi:multisubunit Na+/H+ antiporter MnhB subunit